MNSLLRSRSLPHLNVKHLDQVLLDEHGYLKVVDSAVISAINPLELRIWARNNGVFQFITTEMIAWLRQQIGDRPAIEICAGKGTIGRTLGIPSTDSYAWLQPQYQFMIAGMGEEPTNPPPDVLQYEAMDAVMKFKPEVVVGAFVSQIHQPWEDFDVIPSSPFGVDEELLLKHVSTYIMFGNRNPHYRKRIFKKKHNEYSFPWLHNRAHDQTKNRVWVWTT